MTVEVILGVIAAVMHVVAFVTHAWQTRKGTSSPNPATWILWSFISMLNCVSFITMREHWAVGLLPLVSSVSCIVVFLFYLLGNEFSKLKFGESVALALGIVAVWVWWHYRSAVYANLVLQPAIVISFLPTLNEVWKDSSKEKCLPWFIWSFAYIFILVAIFLEWENKPLQLVYPINCLFLHGIVGMLSLTKPKGDF